MGLFGGSEGPAIEVDVNANANANAMPASTWRYLGILQEKEERGETNREGEEEKEDKEETWLTVFSLPNRSEATREEMRDAKLPIPYRDSCANLLIPLNRCRVDTYYLPWKCENERHSYEKCQYDEFKKRVAKMDELRASKDGARSN
ncbi:NADH-ubiquinone oxidoreductase B18 subunit-domain-containing protein [Nemania serpens]|nr:NADH-ubiquinone oxidoreductase B18 subunit-domain-containing protein [Nemania serpens]